jgi:hypothetical protein
MGYTEKEWEKLVQNYETRQIIIKEQQAYAEKKGVATLDVDVRWVRGKSQWYVKPEKHRIRTMNFD